MNRVWAQPRSSWQASLLALTLLGSTSLAAAQTSDEPLPQLPELPEAQPDATEDVREAPPPPRTVQPALPPAPPSDDGVYPAGGLYEPPPPPPPAPHIAPRSSFLLGARFGYLVPFGKLTYDHPDGFGGPAWRDFAGPGPSFELNAGGRFSRQFLVFGFWEFGAMGAGRDPGFGEQGATHTHLFGAGFRFSSHPDEYGLAVEAAVGIRTFRADFADDVVISAISPEVRIGIGADIRVSRDVTLSPMVQLSNGTFLDVLVEGPHDRARPLSGYEAPHGTFGFALGAHFDLFRSAD